MKKPILKFPPGSEWLYLKIYGGPQALEEWMTGRFLELLSEWKEENIINGFHYVHFLDPDYHLRLRFLLSDPVQSGILLIRIQQSCTEMLDEDLIWKIEVGTYEPEYERYGSERMDFVASWFEVDSSYWLKQIVRLNGESDPDIWKSALRSIDAFLDDFEANLDDKISVVTRLKDSAATLFGLSKSMRSQLDDKYRKMAAELNPLMSAGRDVFLEERTREAGMIIRQIKGTFIDQAALVESTLLPDLIHMSLNRAFRTRHRMQELVLCDFMGRYYESARAREKNVTRDT